MTMLPPPQFDHLPAMAVVEYVLPAAKVNELCRGITHTTISYDGCGGFTKDGRCLVIRIDRDDARRHEYAHCNGWVHPGPGDVTIGRDR